MHRPVIHIHDGAVEEFMATAMINCMDTTDLQSVIVVDGDCLGGIATQAAWQLNQFMGATNVKVGLSAARPKNPFPWQYRSDCILQSAVLEKCGYPRNANWPFAGPFDDTWPPRYPPGDPSIIHEDNSEWVQGFPSGEKILEDQLVSVLNGDTAPVTIAITGPPTPLTTVLSWNTSLVAAIEEVVWYGPALDRKTLELWPVPKGVFSKHSDWNGFWDPDATTRLFKRAPFKLTMIPGSLASTLKIEGTFLDRLKRGESRLQRLAAASYEQVAASKETVMWDTLTVSYLGAESDQIFSEARTKKLRSFAAGPLQGVVTEDDGGVDTKFFKKVDREKFYDFVIETFAAI